MTYEFIQLGIKRRHYTPCRRVSHIRLFWRGNVRLCVRRCRRLGCRCATGLKLFALNEVMLEFFLHLLQLQQNMGILDTLGVRVLTVTFESSGSARIYAEETESPWPVLVDGGRTL